ncbi:MAG: hypothetical protein A2W98_03855 [Bacteroidetes bacterium GWF2_33_38]|nr:MAG: hypothetical protein A2W98_03855 [Bacteroidetes bacterium GWF2_33_38]OFY75723.1 MAG: hypothetical protein A2265_04430 [Bacteroidetes bacterium RIFOXYA12_FULL_33_9]
MKKILIALDYDKSAQVVAEVGYSIAKAMNAKVSLIHVMSDSMQYVSPEHVTIMGFAGQIYPNDENNEGFKKTSFEFLDKTVFHLGDSSIQTVVKEGDIAEAILTAAKDLSIDIIIMGTHSKKWLENIILGSVTEKVLRLTTIPLFVIPTKKQE